MPEPTPDGEPEPRSPAGRESRPQAELMPEAHPSESHVSGKTNVLINNGYTRRVVGFALWHVVSEDIVGERALSESFYSRAWRGINPVYALDAETGEAEFRLARIAAVRMAVRLVEAAPDGIRVPVPVTRDELARALRDCVHAIDQNDGLFASLPAAEQDDVTRCREAAVRLLAQLDREARAELTRAGWVEVPAGERTEPATAHRRTPRTEPRLHRAPPPVAIPEPVGVPDVRRLGGLASEDIPFPG